VPYNYIKAIDLFCPKNGQMSYMLTTPPESPYWIFKLHNLSNTLKCMNYRECVSA